MSKERFMSFARIHPELAKEVLKGNVSWQQLYELYEIYGGEHNIWKQYFKSDSLDLNSFKDIFSVIKSVDLDSVQSGIENIQKTIGLIQDIGVGNNNRNNRGNR